MGRLFSTFANGWPGTGLLMMRIVAGLALIHQGLPGFTPLNLLGAGAGVLLLAGFSTPIAGGVAAIFELWDSYSQPGDPWACILLGTLGAGLAMVGPGAWSVDARLFGWKRIDIRGRR